jgi:hypothetical protein
MRIDGPVDLTPQATPPTDGRWHLYMKADGRLYQLSPSGQESPVAGSIIDGTVVPANAPASYLRFERDAQGHVQYIYLGTAT